MNMGLSISNLTIIAVTVIVVFCGEPEEIKLDWKESAVYHNELNKYYECVEYNECVECEDQLRNRGYNLYLSGEDNLKRKVKIPYILSTTRKIDLENDEDFCKKIYYTGWELNQRNNLAFNYYYHLVNNILSPENMMTVKTWCKIHGNGTFYAPSFLLIASEYDKQSSKPTEEINTASKYIQLYIKRKAKATGLPRKMQALDFKNINVCYNELKNKINTSYFVSKYNKNEIVYFKGNSKYLNWCAVDVCYVTLINAGFLDRSFDENIQIVMVPEFKIQETNGYIYMFYQYLSEKKNNPMNNNQTILNDVKETENLKYWCSVQVCYDDLLEAGYIYNEFPTNLLHVYPSIKNNFSKATFVYDGKYQLLLSRFVFDYTMYLESINTILEENSITLDLKKILEAHWTLRPLEWCKYIIHNQ